MIDRLTKYAHFVLFNKTFNAEQLRFLVLDWLICYHGMSEAYVSNKDKLITSNYWQTLVLLLRTKLKLFTTFYPQTDGQTERINQFLEQYLRYYINATQSNWVWLLPIAQLAINAQQSDTTKESPFFANFGKDPELFLPGRPNRAAQSTIERVNTLKQIYNCILQMQTRSAKYQNKKQKTILQLKKGDKVYLLTANLKTKKPSKKLDHVKVRLFFIEEKKRPVNYWLQLPKDTKIHLVFHVSLLESADPKTPVQTTFHCEPQEDNEYKIEKILKQKKQKYLVKWKGYPTLENTWELFKNFENCQELLEKFQKKAKS